MKVLVISRSPWNKRNSFGNTYSNFFHKFEDIEIANIYLSDGLPDGEERVKAYFQVSEEEMYKSVLRHKRRENRIGRIQKKVESCSEPRKENNYLQSFGKRKRWPILYLGRELVWKFGHMNKDKVLEFVEAFQPDILFLPFYCAVYVNELALFIKRNYDIPIILEASLDIYSLQQISFDPFFWINRFYVRKWIRRTVKESQLLYVISEKQKCDYQKYFDIEIRVLQKFVDESRYAGKYQPNYHMLNFVYTGNIGDGRWKTLRMFAEELACYKGKAKLTIYTATPISSKMRKALSIEGISSLHEPVDSEIVRKIQQEADVLLHVEPFSLKEVLPNRYSISTKIVDYLCTGRCVFALCPNDIASYDYLKDIAITASSKKELKKELAKIFMDHQYLSSVTERINQYVNSQLLPDYARRDFHDTIYRVATEYRKQKE